MRGERCGQKFFEFFVPGKECFNIGKAYEAFPSGNAAKIFAVATIVWLYYPRWRWLGVLLVILSVIGVVGLYFHFVSDVIGGAFLGMTIAIASLNFNFHKEKRRKRGQV